jgi:PDZ domain-containing protein
VVLAVVAGLLVVAFIASTRIVLDEVAIVPGATYPVNKMVHAPPNPYRANGPYLVYVDEEQLTPLGWLILKLTDHSEIYRTSLVAGTCTGTLTQSQLAKEGEWMFKVSEQDAAAAAERAAGLQVTERRDGALVAWVDPTGPSRSLIPQGAVIVSFDGKPIATPADVAAEESRISPGSLVTLDLRVHGSIETVTVKSASCEGRPYIGVGLLRRYDLPVPVKISPTISTGSGKSMLGGPSAGLAWGLYIYALIKDPYLMAGKSVAATGELADDGRVLPIGGLPEKAYAVSRAGIRIFFVPASQPSNDIARARKEAGPRVRIVPVATLSQAISFLESMK